MAEELGQLGAQIETLVRSSISTEVLPVPGERPGVYFLVGPDGVAKKQLADPSWHGEKLATPSELVAFINNRGSDGSAVFFDEKLITYCYSANDRRDVATCSLRLAPQYLWLINDSAKQMKQTEIFRTLRIIFRNCLQSDNFLTLLRNVKFTGNSESQTNIQQGKESLGRKINAEVTGVDILPDEISLTIPIFDNHAFTARVTCALEVFPHEETFKLTPYPQEIKGAMDAAMEDIRSEFSGKDMPPCFRGSPQ